ncbi:MAG TPA: cytochrome c biogenesis protein CcdA [Patescibacteria group bacterium]|nr:cytochrome c biogenesis protein CcdA [Patescibacteria group bacterium]
METVLFQTSLIAAFFAGIVALFAPCCISFLLPAYLGSVFKEKEKVLLMTLIYGLGIFVTLFPAVIGISLISKYLFRFHDSVYYLGGIVLLLVSIITFLGVKMPMPGITRKQKEGKVDALSVFILGIFSGITSACCAPVLVGILTFAFLSPTFFGATLIGIAYVLGMITPLLLISLFLNGKIDKIKSLRKPVSFIKLFGKTYTILLANLIAAAIFFVTGVFTIVLNYQGKFSMVKSESFTKTIQDSAGYAANLFGNNIFINISFLVILVLFLYLLFKKM